MLHITIIYTGTRLKLQKRENHFLTNAYLLNKKKKYIPEEQNCVLKCTVKLI